MRRVLLGVLVVCAACWGQGEEPPGEAVGRFEATGLMVEQSCGAAIPAPDPLDLVFDLREEDGGRAYWRRQGGSIFAGLHKDGQYTFTVTQSWMAVEPDQFRGYAGCSVTQKDTFTFLVDDILEDDGTDENTDTTDPDAGVSSRLFELTGSQTTEIEPLAGADCRPAIAAFNGPFLALPCRVEYVLTGTGVAAE